MESIAHAAMPADAAVMRSLLPPPVELRIALVGCSAQKARRRCAARDMYTSQLFRAARAYAESTCNAWLILSAKYGLVDPSSVIDPYEQRLERATREAWGRAVGAALDAQFPWPAFANVELVVLAGAEYADHIFFPAEREMYWEEPLRGMGIGQRLAWLKKHSRRAA